MKMCKAISGPVGDLLAVLKYQRAFFKDCAELDGYFEGLALRGNLTELRRRPPRRGWTRQDINRAELIVAFRETPFSAIPTTDYPPVKGNKFRTRVETAYRVLPHEKSVRELFRKTVEFCEGNPAFTADDCLKWTDVNWHAKTIRITSTKTKRNGKTERTMPMFDRLEQALSDHWELTGEKSEYVITKEHLRRSGVSLSERFHDIRKTAGVPKFDNPFRNMRLSAVNDVCRIPGITPKTIVDWFGHDMKTALKHYNRTTRQDFDHALSHDPFRNSEIANPKSDVKSDARTYKSGREQQSP